MFISERKQIISILIARTITDSARLLFACWLCAVSATLVHLAEREPLFRLLVQKRFRTLSTFSIYCADLFCRGLLSLGLYV
jgi:hypothetical protein